MLWDKIKALWRYLTEPVDMEQYLGSYLYRGMFKKRDD